MLLARLYQKIINVNDLILETQLKEKYPQSTNQNKESFLEPE